MKHFETPQDLIDEMWELLAIEPDASEHNFRESGVCLRCKWLPRKEHVVNYIAQLKDEERAFAREHEATEKEEAV